MSAPNIIEFCIKNKSVFSKVGRFNNIFPGRIFEPVRPWSLTSPISVYPLIVRLMKMRLTSDFGDMLWTSYLLFGETYIVEVQV